ncbi:hypothetical protein [Paraburkholderia mimosarum]|uniref:hypothetical protein n=1 Tax=Paraburkholderia mimosarum TaxID=312026 RepID=UPI0012B5A1DC|nr:hypothetical protein [Paraburkholderia mimosarum]
MEAEHPRAGLPNVQRDTTPLDAHACGGEPVFVFGIVGVVAQARHPSARAVVKRTPEGSNSPSRSGRSRDESVAHRFSRSVLASVLCIAFYTAKQHMLSTKAQTTTNEI